MASKVDKRKAILESALKNFSKNGFYKAKIYDIAKDAGVGKGTVYEYFESKKSLFENLIKEGTHQYIEEALVILQSNNDFHDKIREFSKFHWKYMCKHSFLIRIMQSEINMPNDLCSNIHDSRIKALNLFKTITKEAIDNGQIRSDVDADMVCMILNGSIAQYFIKKIMVDDNELSEEELDKFLDILINGIG
ncbi:TetR/AcrR family transcriptional regulator [Abyssisolibacter fermentans]|uniref:TetR/AcrR family transcriptional regulator n=1 Tax=Abyssisolibacter fermentans TaxID=1766203 RepID=UPI00082AEC9C|nr:TetR/AcrR family transcriptional regulator [Abyssisolibacter fermentans]